jgi:hypothetical protein
LTEAFTGFDMLGYSSTISSEETCDEAMLCFH